MEDTQAYVSVKTAAKSINKSVATIKRLVLMNAITSTKIKGRYGPELRVNLEELKNYYSQSKTQKPATEIQESISQKASQLSVIPELTASETLEPTLENSSQPDQLQLARITGEQNISHLDNTLTAEAFLPQVSANDPKTITVIQSLQQEKTMLLQQAGQLIELLKIMQERNSNLELEIKQTTRQKPGFFQRLSNFIREQLD